MHQSEAELEIRAASSVRNSSPGVLAGYAAVFDRTADLGEFSETVRSGAFTKSLEKPDGIFALYDHERRSVLGRCGSGTLRLTQDSKGLEFEVDLPDTTIGRDLAVLVERGDVAGCSFAFLTPEGGDRWEMRGGKMHRELFQVDLREITITPTPAYADTTVAKRSMPTVPVARLDTRRAWLETCR